MRNIAASNASSRLPCVSQFARQRIGPLRDRAGAEADHVIARPRQRPRPRRRDRSRTVERDHLAMAARAQAGDQRSRSAPAIGASPAG